MYRRYIILFFLPLASCIAILAVALLGIAGIATPDSHWVVNVSRSKLAIAQGIEDRKIVVIAGSNAYFGIKARILEEVTGVRTVNMATHAGLSFDYLGYVARPVLRKGDIVLLPLEYSFYGRLPTLYEKPVNNLIASVSWAMTPRYIFSLGVGDGISLLRHLNPKRITDGWRSRFVAIDSPPGYQSGGIDRWGDETTDYHSERTAEILRNEMTVAVRNGLPEFDSGISSVNEIRKFLEWCSNRGITVIATWPNTIAQKPFIGPEFEKFRAQIREFYQNRGIAFVDDPLHGQLATDLILDTPYHPTQDGAAIRTAALSAAICAQSELCVGTSKHPRNN